jgi:hypothetical protein
MKKYLTFAVIAFVACALVASHSGTIVLKEFAVGTHPQRVAHPQALDCVILIVSSLGAITLPIIGVILGVAERFGESKG